MILKSVMAVLLIGETMAAMGTAVINIFYILIIPSDITLTAAAFFILPIVSIIITLYCYSLYDGTNVHTPTMHECVSYMYLTFAQVVHMLCLSF